MGLYQVNIHVNKKQAVYIDKNDSYLKQGAPKQNKTITMYMHHNFPTK